MVWFLFVKYNKCAAAAVHQQLRLPSRLFSLWCAVHQALSLATVAPVLAFRVVGWRNGDGSDVVGRGGRFISIVVADLLLGDYSVDFGQDLLKCGFYVRGVQSRSLDEREIISFCNSTRRLHIKAPEEVKVVHCEHLPAKARASSVGTARRWRRSLLFPTSIITIFWSAWSRSSRSHLSTFS